MVGRIAEADDLLGQGNATLAALGPHLGEGYVHPQCAAAVLHQLQLRLGVGGETVNGHHTGQAVDLGDICHVLEQVGKAGLQGGQVFTPQLGFGAAPVVLEGADSSHHHHRIGVEPGQTALNIQELFRAQIGAEAGLSDHIVAHLEGHPGGHDGVAAVGNVGKGAAVDEGGGALQCLHQVGLDGVLEQGGHSSLGPEIVGGYGGAGAAVGHHHPAQPSLQVGEAVGQAEDGHDLRGHGDVETVLPGNTVDLAAQAAHDVAQLAVVHVHAALPGDTPHVDVQNIALLNVVVQHGGQKVIGCADSMEVAGKVEVDVLHRDNLGVAAASRAPLDAEDGPQRRLPQGDNRILAKAAHAVRQTHRGGGLAFARRGWIDGGHQNQFSIGAVRPVVQQLQIDLGLVFSVVLQVFLVHTGHGCNVPNGLYRTGLCDFNIRLHFHIHTLLYTLRLEKREEDGGVPPTSSVYLPEFQVYRNILCPPCQPEVEREMEGPGDKNGKGKFSLPRACLKIGDVSSGEEFWAAGKQFFRRNPDGFQGKIAPSSGQKARRLGMSTFFKQALGIKIQKCGGHPWKLE